VSIPAEVFTRLGGAVGMAARGIAQGKALVGIAKRLVRGSARPGIGSKITKGPLKVGGKVIYGKTGMSTAARVAATVGAGGAGIAAVASHRQTRPATSSAPRRSAPTPSSTSTGERKCCPAGTKRMVCFKRGRVKGKPHASKPLAHRSRAKKARRVSKKKHGGVSKRPVSARQAAARKRFAAAARKGPIRKGTRL
jgi:hypothetical protein